jgi:hypothetical protein
MVSNVILSLFKRKARLIEHILDNYYTIIM